MRINKCQKFNRSQHSRCIKIALIAGAVVLVAIVAAAVVGIPALIAHHNHKSLRSARGLRASRVLPLWRWTAPVTSMSPTVAAVGC